MAEWLVLLLLVPAVVLPVVYLLGFAGCSFQGQGVPDSSLAFTRYTILTASTVKLEWAGGTSTEIEIQRDKIPKPGQSTEPTKAFTAMRSLFEAEDDGLSPDSRYEYKAREIYADGQRSPVYTSITVDTPAIGGPPPVTFDSVSGGHTDSGLGNASTTWSHTATGGSPAAVVGLRWSQTGGIGDATRTVTYGGVTMQSLGVRGLAGEATNAIAAEFVEFFGIRNPSAGAQTVSVTVARGASSLSFEACSVSYANVSAFVATTPVSGNEAGTSMTQPVNSAVNEMVVQMFGTETGAVTGYTQTPRHISANGLLIGDAPGAPAISFTANRAGGANYAGVAVRLTPVP